MSETIGLFIVTVQSHARTVTIHYNDHDSPRATFDSMSERDMLDLQYVLKRTLAELHRLKKQ